MTGASGVCGMETGARREKLHSLQGLRAIAAITVLVFHVCNDAALGLHFAPDLLRAFKVAADCAVDCFFVLSGFIMVYTQAQSQRGAGEFARQRIARIVPLYWATTLAFTLFVLVGEAGDGGIGGALVHLKASKNYIGSSMLFVSHLLGYRFPVLLPGWSLEYEMLFYALFAGAIVISRRHTVAVVVALLVALTLSGLMRPLCIEFAAGTLVAQLWFRGGHRALAAVMLLVAPAVVVAGLFGGYYALVDDNDWLRVVFCGLPMLTVFLVALCSAQRRRPMLSALGDCSYAIYVSHCAWLAVYVRYLMPLLPKSAGSALVLASGIAWCLAGGIAMHYAVEKRFDRMLRARRAKPAAVAAAGMAAAPLPGM